MEAKEKVIPTPIRKNLQRMLELKVGITAMEAEYKRLRDGILQTKYAPQVYGDPNLGKLTQKMNVSYDVNIKTVIDVVGKDRALEMATISKTSLEANTTKVELTKLEDAKAITKTNGAVTYTFTAAKPPKEAK